MALVARVKIWVTGDVLTASDLNGEFNILFDAINGGLDSSNFTTFTTIALSNPTTTETIAITTSSTGPAFLVNNGGGRVASLSATGVFSFVGSNTPGWLSNLALTSATTTNANDSIKITSASGTALSTTNPGWASLPSVAVPGLMTLFLVVADITINLTGAHWGNDTAGDLTGSLLDVLLINDNGTLKAGVAWLTGRDTLLTTDTSSIQASITAPEHVLCNTTITSASNSCVAFGFFRTNFDDTGGAAENLWANQNSVGDIVTGKSSDGLWQDWNPTFTGFSVNPGSINARWTQIGRVIHLFANAGSGTSNATTMTISNLPAAARHQLIYAVGQATDNGVAQTTPGRAATAVGSRTLTMGLNLSAGGGFTASGSKWVDTYVTYEVGPAASFIS